MHLKAVHQIEPKEMHLKFIFASSIKSNINNRVNTKAKITKELNASKISNTAEKDPPNNKKAILILLAKQNALDLRCKRENT